MTSLVELVRLRERQLKAKVHERVHDSVQQHRMATDGKIVQAFIANGELLSRSIESVMRTCSQILERTYGEVWESYLIALADLRSSHKAVMKETSAAAVPWNLDAVTSRVQEVAQMVEEILIPESLDPDTFLNDTIHELEDVYRRSRIEPPRDVAGFPNHRVPTRGGGKEHESIHVDDPSSTRKVAETEAHLRVLRQDRVRMEADLSLVNQKLGKIQQEFLRLCEHENKVQELPDAVEWRITLDRDTSTEAHRIREQVARIQGELAKSKSAVFEKERRLMLQRDELLQRLVDVQDGIERCERQIHYYRESSRTARYLPQL